MVSVLKEWTRAIWMAITRLDSHTLVEYPEASQVCSPLNTWPQDRVCGGGGAHMHTHHTPPPGHAEILGPGLEPEPQQ